MNIIHTFFLQIFLVIFQTILSDPVYNNDRYGCGESNDDLERSNQLADSHYKSYNEHPNFYAKNRQRKRQVGVIYGNGRPIGILQPYKRSYKFMPVREEFDANPLYKVDQIRDLYSSGGVMPNVGKRETEQEYPSILTNFKIDTKLDKKNDKRNDIMENDDRLLEERDVARKMRSPISIKQTNPIEGQLKSILNDLGFMDYNEDVQQQKRESVNERNKREDLSTLSPSVKASATSNSEEKDGGVSEASATASECERNKRLSEDETNNNSEYEMKIQKEIQDKIESLKEQVKREIANLQSKQKIETDEMQRKKRQTSDTLADEETEEINPENAPESDLKPLIRKRRLVTEATATISMNNERRKREIEEQDEDEEENEVASAQDKNQIELLENNARNRRSDNNNNLMNTDVYDYEYDEERLKREDRDGEEESDRFQDDSDENERYKRAGGVSTQVKAAARGNGAVAKSHENDMKARSMKQAKTRRRRRIEDLSVEQPQQLSDMSDLELFGALPPGYDGELSRFKRVKRFRNHE